MKPGDVVTYDFRENSEAEATLERPLRIVQWNIERGYELEKVITELREIDADVLGLQEIDIGCERSGSVDTGKAIAGALHLNYCFVCEFEELHSPLRDARSQGGGFHGNAIFSKFDLTNMRAIEHRCHPVDWENPKHALAEKEPRKGRRLSLAAEIATRNGPLVCYSCHLEVFCGMLARMAQFSDVLKDSKEQIDVGKPHQVILGDLNTMGHGIARFSPNFCCDAMRFRNIGWSEAEVWERDVFAHIDPKYSVESTAVGSSCETAQQQPGSDGRNELPNARLRSYGLPEDVCRDIQNPRFVDPFDSRLTITLDNPAYKFWGYSLMCGKLDWLLLRRLKAVKKSIGNHQYQASDHKWLSADVQFA